VWIVRWTFIALIVILILGFSLQNTDLVKIDIWTWHSGQIPIYLVIYCAFAAGMLTFLIVALFYQIQHQAALRNCRRDIKRLQQELDRLRTMSLQDGLDEDQAEPAADAGEGGKEL